MKRFPSLVYRDGQEPDPRFSLANERTFLAWIRTSLALLAGGVGLEAIGIPSHTGMRLVAAGVLLALGLLAAVLAWVGWARTERALRRNRPLPGPNTAVVIVIGLSVVAALVIAGMFS